MHSISNTILFLLVVSYSFVFIEALKCNYGVGRGMYEPYECAYEEEKCWMGYTGINKDAAYMYKCKPNDIAKGPEIIVKTVNDDEIQCYRRYAIDDSHQYSTVECFCETDLCNSIDSPTHDEILKIVDNITEHKYLECYDGLIHRSSFTRSNAIVGCKASDAVCNIVYEFDEVHMQSCGEAPAPNEGQIKVFVTGHLMKHILECDLIINNGEATSIRCFCRTHRCNAIGSVLHKAMLDEIIKAGQNDISGLFILETSVTGKKPSRFYPKRNGVIGSKKPKEETTTNVFKQREETTSNDYKSVKYDFNKDPIIYEWSWGNRKFELSMSMLILGIILIIAVVLLLCTICVCFKTTVNAED